MAASIVTNCRGACGKPIDPKDLCHVINGEAWHVECVPCAKCAQPLGSIHGNSYVCVQENFYHPRCTGCGGECGVSITPRDVAIDEELYISAKSEKVGEVKTLWHCECYGCSCGAPACKEVINCKWVHPNRIGLCWTDKDRDREIYLMTRDRCRRYGDTVLKPAHRKCTRCKKNIGDHTDYDGPATERAPHHSICTVCDACVVGEEHRGVITGGGPRSCRGCAACHVCKTNKRMTANGKRAFIHWNGGTVHTDCVTCDRCHTQEDNRHVKRDANGEYVHVTCPRAALEALAKKRKRE